jgi:hypothetical protein
MKDDQQSDTGSTLLSIVQIPAQPLSAQTMSVGGASGIMLQGKPGHTTKKDQESRLKFAEETHQYIRECIRLADQKATFFFAGSSALLAYLHKLGLASKWILTPTTWSLAHVLSFFASIGLLLCAIACLLAVMPRLKGSKRGIVFFAAINEYNSSNDYVSEFMNKSLFDLCEEKLKHAYELSAICKRKYVMLKWGQWLGAIGLIATLLLLVLL